ncbi:MAG TPA: hypothetical protein VL346_05110 [Acidobacteriaceae bacterium]|nr:hypothetical protein [Acidobacteriaceae bacterium]
MFLTPCRRSAALPLMLLLTMPIRGRAWGNEGHRLVNRLAASNLPADVPAFLRAASAADEIEYLGPEPDRWRSLAEPELERVQAAEHFIELEPADALGPLPHNRYDFEASVFSHGERPETIGLQPWQTNEVWQRLKAAMREYRHLAASPAQSRDLAGAQAAVLFYAGWLGHYVGDGAQPLHTTVNHDGWQAKENPHRFSPAAGIHWRFEGTFVDANIVVLAPEAAKKIAPVQQVAADPAAGGIFDSYVAYLRHSGKYMDEVYSLDQAGGFTGKGTEASRDFTATRLAAGASELRDLIYAAWLESAKPAPSRY